VAAALRKAHDLFPLEPLVPVDLIPGEVADLLQRVETALLFVFLQPKPALLKDFIV
jgi:hypothetical protein